MTVALTGRHYTLLALCCAEWASWSNGKTMFLSIQGLLSSKEDYQEITSHRNIRKNKTISLFSVQPINGCALEQTKL